MSDDAVNARNGRGIVTMMRPWREELFEKVVRITAIVATPVIAVGLYYLVSTRSYWMIPIALIAYGVVVIGTLVPAIRYAYRVWAFVGVLFVLGAMDLLTFGWGEDARIYLMSAMLFTTIFLGSRHGLVALVIAIVMLTAFVATAGFGWFVPFSNPDVTYALSALLIGLVVFVMLASALFTSFNYLFPRLFTALAESSQLSARLEADRATLAERTQTLQDANLGLQRRALMLDASVQVSKTLAIVFEMESLLERAAETIAQHFDLFHVAIYLAEDAGRWMVLRAASSMTGRQMLAQDHRQQRGDASAVGRVAATRSAYLAEPGEATTPDFPTIQSGLTVPLLVDETLVGVLDLKSAEEAAFDQDSVRTLEGVAGQLAVAIENVRHFGDEVAVLETTSPIYRLVHQLAVTRSVQDVYDAMLRTVGNFSPARSFFIQTSGSAGVVADIAEMWGDAVRVSNAADLGLENLDALLALCADLMSPLLVADVSASHAIPDPMQATCLRLLKQLEFRSIALVPVRAGHDLLGMLMVLYDTAHQFSPLEVQLYRIIEESGGVALERLALVNEARARVERERWLREFGEHIMRIPDLSGMMAEAAQSLRSAIRADGVTVSVALPDTTSSLPVDDENQ